MEKVKSPMQELLDLVNNRNANSARTSFNKTEMDFWLNKEALWVDSNKSEWSEQYSGRVGQSSNQSGESKDAIIDEILSRTTSYRETASESYDAGFRAKSGEPGGFYWKQIIINRINHFSNNHHSFEANKLHEALNTIATLVPPSYFDPVLKASQSGEGVESLLEWAKTVNIKTISRDLLVSKILLATPSPSTNQEEKQPCRHENTRPGWAINQPSICNDCREEL